MLKIKYVDFQNKIEISFKNLAHWDQPVGRIQFITIRLGDSIPDYVMVEYSRQRDALISRLEEAVRMHYDIVPIKMELSKVRRVYDKYADRGHGECVFRSLQIRQIMENILLYNDGESYIMLQYVIMPNHIHMLLIPEIEMEDIMNSIMRYSTRQINRELGRAGKLWQGDYFDRMVRNKDTLVYYYNYIKNNPVGLDAGTYSYYESELLLEYFSEK